MKIERLQRYRGTFNPLRTDDLRSGMNEHIGKRAVFEAGWVIDEEDGGPYVGQWAMLLLPPQNWPCVWVPECDLDCVELEDER